MTFVVSKVTVASPVTTGGTLTFAYPANPLSGDYTIPMPFDPSHPVMSNAPQPLEQTSAGDFITGSGHYAYSSGNQARLVFGVDFSLTFNNTISAGVTFTYLGASTLPVGSLVTLQLEMIGQDDGAPFKNDGRRARAAMCPVEVIRFGTPLAASTTAVLSAGTATQTLLTLQTLATPVVLDIPRNLTIVSSTTDTTQTITVRGLDEFGQAMTESAVLNGATSVVLNKAFKTVISYQASAVTVGTLSIGTGVKMGLPVFLPSVAYVLNENVDNAQPTRGTFVRGDQTAPTATTGDVRGTYSPNAAPNAVHYYEVFAIIPDPKALGLANFAG